MFPQAANFFDFNAPLGDALSLGGDETTMGISIDVDSLGGSDGDGGGGGGGGGGGDSVAVTGVEGDDMNFDF